MIFTALVTEKGTVMHIGFASAVHTPTECVFVLSSRRP